VNNHNGLALPLEFNNVFDCRIVAAQRRAADLNYGYSVQVAFN
jgi:hypothetical protein